MNDIISNLCRELLEKVSEKIDNKLFVDVISSIRKITDCTMCTLWRVNTNSTNKPHEDKSTSLVVRVLKPPLKYPSNYDDDFVHNLNDGSLIQCVLSKIKEKSLQYKLCDIESCEEHCMTDCKKIRAKESLQKINLRYFFSIPIYDQDKTNIIIALLILSFEQQPKINDEERKHFSTIINSTLSSCLYRNMRYKKQQIIEGLVENYKENGAIRDLGDIFYPILNDENIIISSTKEKKDGLKKHCPYDGASIFIWDSFKNHYKLLSTTGIEGINNKCDYDNVFYLNGDGKTGEVANTRSAKIYYDLSVVEQHTRNGMYIEKTIKKGKTMMVIPILCPSKRDEVIGILRFVNKQNYINRNVVDYFNDADVELMSCTADYFALIIDYFSGEKERINFISRLSHEFRTPANSIRISAESLIRNQLIDKRYTNYMESILYSAEYQMQQVETNLYLSKIRSNIPKSKKYNPTRKQLLKEIINKSKDIVKAIAREEGILFDNIVIDKNFPSWRLYIDEFAFTTIFCNLLTNTIKYRSSDVGFHVEISGYETNDDFIICVSDYGLGIDENDKDKIFRLGVRGKNGAKRNTSGFGIGLPLIKHIIEDFGGIIRVAHFRSPTKFEMKLPSYLLKDDYIKTEQWNSM